MECALHDFTIERRSLCSRLRRSVQRLSIGRGRWAIGLDCRFFERGKQPLAQRGDELPARVEELALQSGWPRSGRLRKVGHDGEQPRGQVPELCRVVLECGGEVGGQLGGSREGIEQLL